MIHYTDNTNGLFLIDSGKLEDVLQEEKQGHKDKAASKPKWVHYSEKTIHFKCESRTGLTEGRDSVLG